jgi:phosphomannomutase
VPDGDTKGRVSEQNLLGEYAAHVRSFVDVDSLRPLKVVADTANGMGGLVAPAVFEGLPYELEIMFGDLDGTFPNHPPDPINPENLKALQARVLEVGADVGLAFDGDADRVFLIDEKAQPMSGSTTTAFVAKSILRKAMSAGGRGEKVIYNLICSKSVPEIIIENGGEPIRTRVGHSFIKSVMADTGAIFGGEHSGHYYFRDNYRADSGLIAAMLVLEELSRVPEPLSELRKPLERYSASGEVNVEVSDPPGTVERVSEAYADADQERIDGLTVDLGEWWFNLRPSNTEPLLRLNLEAPDDGSCKKHLSEVLALIKEET